MKKKISAVSGLLFLLSSVALAESSMDRNVKSALDDISKYEEQFLSKSKASKPSIKRTLKLLKLTRQRLDDVDDQAHPAWIEADQRFNNLQDHLNLLLDPGSVPTPKSASTTASSGSSSVAKPKVQNTTTASAPAKQMISQQRVRIKKLDRDIKSATDSLDKAGPKPFQDPAYVAQYEKRLANFENMLSRYQEFASDPDVVNARVSLDKFAKFIGVGKDHAAKELTALGSVQDTLKSTEAKIRQLVVHPAPQQPYQQGDMEKWVKSLATTRNAALQIYKPLPEIAKRAWLPNNRQTVQQGAPYDLNDVKRLDHSLRGIVGKIDQSVKENTLNMKTAVEHASKDLEFYQTMDPKNPEHIGKHFMSKGRASQVREALSKTTILLSEAVSYSRLLKHNDLEQRTALLQKAQAVTEQYETNYKKARGLVRLPAPASTDSDLIEIAKETLSNPKYEYVGDIERMVINAEKVSRTKKTSEASFDKIDVSLSGKVTLSGTETTYFYDWDQFQVATAEPADGKYYIFYTTLKYFRSGASTTPLNKWIISSRLQGSEIPKENINLN